MTREEAIAKLKEKRQIFIDEWADLDDIVEAFDIAIEALSADAVEVVVPNSAHCDKDTGEWHIKTRTIPTFKESEEAYKAWTGEEMGGASDLKAKDETAIDNAFRKWVRDIASADRPHGEWVESKASGWKCSVCNKWSSETYGFCPNCGAKMGGDGE